MSAAEDAIQGIISAIVMRCQELGNEAVDDNLAAYMARMVVIDNAERFPSDRTLTEHDVEELVKVPLPRMPASSTDTVRTLRLSAAVVGRLSSTNYRRRIHHRWRL